MAMKVFNLGFPYSGEEYVYRAFCQAGLRCTSLNGECAKEIIFSSTRSRKNISKETDLKEYFSVLENAKWMTGHLYSAQYEFKFLDDFFPHSSFILLTRNEASWLKDVKDSGYLDLIAYHYKRRTVEAEALLIQKRLKHQLECRKYFGDSKRYFEVDVYESGMEKVFEYLRLFEIRADWSSVKSEKLEPYVNNKPSSEEKNNAAESDRLKGVNNIYFPLEEAAKVAERLANHCVPSIDYNSSGYSACSKIYASWPGEVNKVEPSNVITRLESGLFINRSDKWKIDRVTSVLSEVQQYNPVGDIRVDMQDGRLYGSKENPIGGPVITYCRRRGVKNLILWPLPGYHTIQSPGFLESLSEDIVCFKDKKDIAVWRGALSGYCSDILNGEYTSAAYAVCKAIIDNGINSNFSARCFEQLEKNIRLKFVRDNIASQEVDAKLVLKGRFKPISEREGYKELFDASKTIEWFREHKYIICLRGYDTASNFLMAAASKSVALKEEDGWEVFYSCLFKPWEHYIPLKPGGEDVLDKLAWAREHQKECEEIVQNANKACRYLIDNRIREMMCSEIIEKMNSIYLSYQKVS